MISFQILERGVGLILDRVHEREVEFDSLNGHRHRVQGRTFIADEAINKYDAVRISGSGRVKKADYSTTANARVVGVASASAAAGERVAVVTWGEVVNPNWSFNPGEFAFVSTAGTIVTTPPPVGKAKGTVGVVLEPTTIMVRPDSYITVV